jgi:pimeloyl-ACP methyl ester carboxylesterase
LLRGLGREAGHWHDFPEQLQRRLGLSEGAVVCLDLPGIGDQRTGRASWSVAAMADDIRERWLELVGGQSGHWGVLGISLGGMVALEWAARFPEDLATVAVINSSDRRSGLWFERLRLQVLPLMLRIALARRLERREELTFRLSTQMLEGERRRTLLAERIEIARERPVRAGVVGRQLIAAAFWTAPRALAQPLLVMLSEGDRMVNPRCSERLAANLGASLVRHPVAGHEIPLDDPEWVCDRLAEWQTGGSALEDTRNDASAEAPSSRPSFHGRAADSD